jgi:hypothetical protein
MPRYSNVVLFAIGLLHLIPALGALSAERLTQLYGIAPGADSIVLLLRHRAVLFALLGSFCCAAAFVPAWQAPALVAALISVVSFLLLGWGQTLSASLRMVWWADIAAAVLLLSALAPMAAARLLRA